MPSRKNGGRICDRHDMDSAGMGVVVNGHVHCQSRGGKFIAVGVSPRILELFKMTHVDKVIAMAATVNEAEALA